MLEQNTREPVGRRPGIVVDEGEAADLSQDFAEERIEFLVIRQEWKNFSRGPRDEE
jgi:hypothetical protein